MFGSLLKKECALWMKSIVFYAYVILLFLFYISQMGEEVALQRPQPGADDYGSAYSDDENIIMNGTLKDLVVEFEREGPFITYPVGFYKEVTLSEEEREQIAACISELSGMSREEWETAYDVYLEGSSVSLDENGRYVNIEKVPWSISMDPSITYEQFEKIMAKVAEVIGPGSDYEEEQLKKHGIVDKTYEQELSDYEDILYKDKVTGAYARLFSDYLGIVLGILPAFFGVTRVLKDKRSYIKGVIYSKKAGAAAIVGARYLGMVLMMFVPVLLVSCLPLTQSLYIAYGAGAVPDYFAYLKYSFGWLLPIILFVTALSYLLTELTESLLGILICAAVWFNSVFTGSASLVGAGWNLIPRFNSVGKYQMFREMLPQLVRNRILYTVAALVTMAATMVVYDLKRKGVMGRRGKISENFKNKSEI